jgi:hypothetical protein
MQSRDTRNSAEGYTQTFDWPHILREKGRYAALFCLLSLINQLTNAVHKANFALRNCRPLSGSCCSRSFMNPEGSLPRVPESIAGPYFAAVKSVPQPHPTIFSTNVIITLPLSFGSPGKPLSLSRIYVNVIYRRIVHVPPILSLFTSSVLHVRIRICSEAFASPC